MDINKKQTSPLAFVKGLFHSQEHRTEETTHSIDIASLAAIFGDNKQVNAQEALEIPAFSACVNLIANTLASMPVQLYSETDGQTEPITDGRVLLLNDDTGDLLNGVQFKTALVRDYLLYGAGYAYINRQGNTVKSLHYIKASDVSVRKNSDPIFKDAVFYVNGKSYEEYDFIKLCRNTKDGVTGRGLVLEMSELLTAQYNLLKFEKVLAASGGSKKGFLQAEKRLTGEAMQALRKGWKELYSSPETGVLILNDGLKYTDANQTSVEMQLVELMKRGADEVCLSCEVPSALLSGQGSEAMWQMMYKTALSPIVEAFEATLNRDLLLFSEKKKLYFAFDTKKLMRGDMLSRYQAYAVALQNGFMQPDEVRYAEDLPPLNLGFIKLGLSDVLYDPKTGRIYTPNTDKVGEMGENGLQSDVVSDTIENRYNENHGEDGKFTSGSGGGGADASSGGGVSSASGGANAQSGATYADSKLHEYINNPASLAQTTPQKKYDDFVAHGVDVQPLSGGKLKGVPFPDGGGFKINNGRDSLFLYHPDNRSHHGGAYYKISNGVQGIKHYFLDGTEFKN